MMAFIGADPDQVIFLYALLAKRTVLGPFSLGPGSLWFRAQSPLTVEEATYALETVLALNGICVVKDGTNLVQVVPIAQRRQVRLGAPKPEPGARLFDPHQVPSIGITSTRGSPSLVEQEFDRLRRQFHGFMHLPDPEKRKAQRLLDLYAHLAGKSAVESQDLGGRAVRFHVDTPLTRNELLYAIETTFALDGFAIIPVAGGKVRLGRAGEVPAPRP